jgi:hypothetical protein
LWARIERDRPDHFGDTVENLPRDVADGPMRGEGNTATSAIAVLDHSPVGVQVHDDDERARPLGGGKRRRLPAPSSEAERGVLELRLLGRESSSKFSEHLRVGVERVARRTPLFVGKRDPSAARRHD